MSTAMKTMTVGGAAEAGGEGRDVDDREDTGDEQLISQLAQRARVEGLTLTLNPPTGCRGGSRQGW